jgi:phenylalanyl-tRNA synthetase beta chain
MRFSLNFIKEFLDIKVSAQALADKLTMAGMEVEQLTKVGNDWVFDIEVTTNRYDWLSMIGIAREIAACLHKKSKVTYPKIRKTPRFNIPKIVIKNTDDCPFYVGQIITDVKIKESPKWLLERVNHCEISAINNVVDATNYCMLKWGNPLHAFDADKIEGNIYIRRAKKGEKFIGLDEKERILSVENLVIADDKKVIALAGVMGAKNTEVDENTKNIFLEAAIFSPGAVRRSRRSAGIDTESSYRFERMVHPDHLEYAAAESVSLIEDIAKGKFKGIFFAGKKPLVKRKNITVDLKKLTGYLGEELSQSMVKKIISNLGFDVKASSKNKIIVTTPSFRFDFEREVDVYEEIARIHGYAQIKPQLPFLTPALGRKFTVNDIGNLYHFKNELRQYLPSLSLREIITYSIEYSKQWEKLKQDNCIKLLNPLRSQEDILRPSLLLGMIKAVRGNLNRNQKDLRFFEIAHVYSQKEEGFCEKAQLIIGITGQRQELFQLKGSVVQILKHLHVKEMAFKEEPLPLFTNAAIINVGGKKIGFWGKLDDEIRKEFDLNDDLFIAQLDIAKLKQIRLEKRYIPYSLYPAVSRDVSLALNKNKKFAQIEKAIQLHAKEYLSNIMVVDEYYGKDIPKDHLAFTIRISYQSKHKTLTTEEVDNLHTAIREQLSKEEGVILR